MIRKIYLPILLATLFTGCGGGGTSAASTVTNNTPMDTNTLSTSSVFPFEAPILSENDKQDYLDAINNARRVQRDCGRVIGVDADGKAIKVYDGNETMPVVQDLTWNDKLYSIASEHSVDLAAWNNGVVTEVEARSRFSHEGSGTISDWTAQKLELGRGSTTGERVDNSGYVWQAYGENIAAGNETSTEVHAVQQWLSSPTHCANLMSSDYTEVGMAMKEDANSFYTYYWTQNFGAQ